MDHNKLRKSQAAQTKLLGEFDAFCREHGLTYFIAYGTLLGAVRHHGFIPWDEDMDTVMTRPEYEKLAKVMHLLPKHIKIYQECYSDIEHSSLLRIVANDGTPERERIDLFILDYAREGLARKRWMSHVYGFLHMVKLSKSEKAILMKHFKSQPLKQAVVQLSKLFYYFFGGSAATERLIFKIRTSRKPTKHYVTMVDSKSSFPVKYFSEAVPMEFDGYEFLGTSRAHEMLTEMYGNYMEIPPEGHQWLKEEGLE